MVNAVEASTEPEKRLFISLLTRDISFVDAFLDLIDNSVNSALIPYADRLQNANDYADLFLDASVTPKTFINLSITETSVTISDNAAGIDLKTAVDRVFRFGRPASNSHPNDRLSVYGIGLKRAIFKIGDHIEITSDHVDGGFSLDWHVDAWASDPNAGWKIPLSPRPETKKTGTRIKIGSLHENTKRRIIDGSFLGELIEKIGRTYAYFLGKIITVSLNGQEIPAQLLSMSDNFRNSYYDAGAVTYSITAGIAKPAGKSFQQETAGWYVFCNGRTVIFADKSPLSGWGDLLPQFQPKHRPFLGVVFFVSTDAEELPWTTTKASVDVENVVWQVARRQMESIGRTVLGFLDQRYTEDGTEVDAKELTDASATTISLLAAATSTQREFAPPPRNRSPTKTSIQYKVSVSDLEKVKSHIGRSSMSNVDVGRYTFDYYLRNEVE